MTMVDQYNVSPKLSHSGNPADLALMPERLEPNGLPIPGLGSNS